MKSLLFSLGSALSLSLLLSSCSTGRMKSLDRDEIVRNSGKEYSAVLIQDFTTAYTAEQEQEMEQLGKAKQDFPNLIAARTLEKGGFENVWRSGQERPGVLLVEGFISKWDEGGLDGRSFDAVVYYKDASTGLYLGKSVLDKNSLGVGAGDRDVTSKFDLMERAARNVAYELQRLSQGNAFIYRNFNVRESLY
ncbi:MAG: hypothetical protein AAF555_05005 [Verrucomicrobiota bacterium]